MDNEKVMMNNMFYQEEEEQIFDFSEFFVMMLAHWKAILITTLIVAVAFGAYCKMLVVPVYDSTARIYVLSTDSSSLLSLADLQVGNKLQEDYVDVIQSRPILDQVISNLGLEMNYKQLYKKIRVTPSTERIIKITVRDTDPSVAKVIADEIADLSCAYISDYMEQNPPAILQYGYDDESKVGPSTRKYCMAGAALGFVISSLLVIIPGVLNNMIEDPDDVGKKLGLNLLGTIPLDKSQRSEKNSKTNKKRKRG